MREMHNLCTKTDARDASKHDSKFWPRQDSVCHQLARHNLLVSREEGKKNFSFSLEMMTYVACARCERMWLEGGGTLLCGNATSCYKTCCILTHHHRTPYFPISTRKSRTWVEKNSGDTKTQGKKIWEMLPNRPFNDVVWKSYLLQWQFYICWSFWQIFVCPSYVQP